MSILSLYQSILIPIFSEWINDRDLCSVDTSICNKNLRSAFLTTLRRCFIIHTASVEEHYEERLDWINLRDMKLLAYVLGDHDAVMMSEKMRDLFMKSKHVINIRATGCIAFADVIISGGLKVDSLKLLSIKSDEELQAVLTALDGVFSLDISAHTFLSLQTCSIIAYACPNLRNLIVRTGTEIQPILENCDVEYVKYVDGVFVFNLPETSKHRFSCELVKSSIESALTVSVCNKLYLIKGLLVHKQLTPEEVKLLEPHIGALEIIEFKNEDYPLPETKVMMILMTARCTRLTAFSAMFVCIQDFDFEAVLRLNNQIRRISLRHCEIDTRACLSSITRNCPKLEYLVFYKSRTVKFIATDELMVDLCKGCPLLTDLNMDSMIMSVKAVCDLSRYIESLALVESPRVRCMRWRKVHRGLKCLHITTESLPSLEEFLLILSNNPSLQRVRIPSFYALNRETVESIVNWCPLITHFSYVVKHELSGDTFLPLTQCKHLVCLSMNGNASMTDSVITEILKEKPGFVRLSLFFCRGITGAVLQSLAQYCPNIKHVCISCCLAVTDNDVIALLTRCTQIDYLNLYKCKAITSAILPYFKRRMRQLILRHTSISRSEIEAFVELTGFNCTIKLEY